MESLKNFSHEEKYNCHLNDDHLILELEIKNKRTTDIKIMNNWTRSIDIHVNSLHQLVELRNDLNQVINYITIFYDKNRGSIEE